MADHGPEIAKKIIEGYNKDDVKSVARYIDEKCVLTDFSLDVRASGRKGCVEWMEAWKKGFPDSKLEITKLMPVRMRCN